MQQLHPGPASLSAGSWALPVAKVCFRLSPLSMKFSACHGYILPIGLSSHPVEASNSCDSPISQSFGASCTKQVLRCVYTLVGWWRMFSFPQVSVTWTNWFPSCILKLPKSFNHYWCPDPVPRDSDVIGVGCSLSIGIFKHSQGNSAGQPEMRILILIPF